MGIIVGIILFWIMWVTIEGELIDEGTLKPRKGQEPKPKRRGCHGHKKASKPEERNDLSHLFKD